MHPPSASSNVAPDSSADKLLQLGPPFVRFPRFSILDVQRERDFDNNPLPFSEWLTKHLEVGKPFVLSDFDKLNAWPKPASANPNDGSFPSFTIERLIELSTKKNIPIRNCSTGRDLSFTLSKFVDSARQSYSEFQNLYARDLQCPQEWLEKCSELLPTEVQWGGRLDLFRWLPACARSEVMMAYVGSEGSCSGFHRCFSSTVALNFLIDTEDERPVVCIGTDFESQQKYDAFMTARGVSPHLDWHNVGPEDMREADFPLYVYDQRVGDLVVLPPATAHQIWNPSTLTTKLVWNILHPLSLEVGIKHVQAPFNRLCHPDVARTNLSLASAMLSLKEDQPETVAHLSLPPDLPLLSRLFRQMVHDEGIESQPLATPITPITLGPGVIATCNFCSTAIWNRHVRCTVCTDFDLCLLCYLNGRSCEHAQSYTWAEIVSPEQCTRVLNRAREILGFQPEEPRLVDRCKTLGTAVNDLMKAKKSNNTRLCHLCRIDHPEWKGRRCDSCTAFFCYRGLYRHFDMAPTDVLRHSGIWTCPKCDETCNCRCCHFATAYVKSEKPASKRRVKAVDSRGRVMGFADNVFDQKRGGRRESAQSASTSQLVGKKRSIEPNGQEGPMTPLRKLEFPTPEPDFLGRAFISREGSEYPILTSYNATLPPILPNVKAMTDSNGLLTSPIDERRPHVGPNNPTYVTNGNNNILPPMRSTGIYDQSYNDQREREQNGQLAHIPGSSSVGHSGSSFLNTVTLPSQDTNTSQALSERLSSRPPGPAMTPSTESPPAAASIVVDRSIAQLEQKIQVLRKYDEEFVALKLEDSRKMLQQQLTELETQLSARKKERGIGLIERLKREGLITLAEAVGVEVGIARMGQSASMVGLGINESNHRN